MTNIRWLTHPPRNRYTNMAVDEALLRQVQDPVIRFYQWTEPDAVSIGYFEPWRDVPAGRPFVRRYTGGGLVDHNADFTYTIVLPREHPLARLGTGPSYEAIHRAVAEALALHGFAARLAAAPDPTDHPACFQKAVRYDVVDDRGGKLAGAAQRRNRSGCLHQGSILPGKPFDRPALANTLIKSLALVLQGEPQPDDLTTEEISLADELVRSRYSLAEWNQSR